LNDAQFKISAMKRLCKKQGTLRSSGSTLPPSQSRITRDLNDSSRRAAIALRNGGFATSG